MASQLRAKSTPLVSVVVLNFNGNGFLSKCVNSVLNSRYGNLELIVVDNASSDGSIQSIVSSFCDSQKLHVVLNHHNYGFCEGNNIGAMHARGEYLFFLNNDAWLDPDCLSVLMQYASVGGPNDIYATKFFSMVTGRAEINLIDRYGQGLPTLQPDHAIDTFAVGGGDMLIKRDLFNKIGGFDSDLFIYMDDVDISWRARLVGARILKIPNANAYHIGSQTLGKQAFVIRRYLQWRNTIRVLAKNHQSSYAVVAILTYLLVAAAECTYASLKTREARVVNSFLRMMWWNIANLPSTLLARRRIRSMRVVSDKEIRSMMVQGFASFYILHHYPARLASSLRNFAKT